MRRITKTMLLAGLMLASVITAEAQEKKFPAPKKI